MPDLAFIIRAEIRPVNKSTLIHFQDKLTRIAAWRIIGTYPNTALPNQTAIVQMALNAQLFRIAAYL